MPAASHALENNCKTVIMDSGLDPWSRVILEMIFMEPDSSRHRQIPPLLPTPYRISVDSYNH